MSGGLLSDWLCPGDLCPLGLCHVGYILGLGIWWACVWMAVTRGSMFGEFVSGGLCPVDLCLVGCVLWI